MRTKTLSGVLLVGLMGCAGASHSQQLVDAREVVKEAENGKAARYSPDDLYDAQKLLDQAEEAKDGSTLEEHYAYLADRQAREATANGLREHYLDQEAASEDEYLSLQEEGRREAERKLAQTERDLDDVRRQLEESDENSSILQQRQAELEKEKSQLKEELGEAKSRAEAAMASLEEMAQVENDERETRITLSGSVLFPTDKSTLLPIAENTLSTVADALADEVEGTTIVVEGHTDSRGTADYNKRLSKDRAESVKQYLVGQGLSEGQLTAVGKGEEEPVASNDNPEGRANNRRVELVVQRPEVEEGQKSGSTAHADQKSGSRESG